MKIHSAVITLMAALCLVTLASPGAAADRRDGGTGDVPKDFKNTSFGKWGVSVRGEPVSGCSVELSSQTRSKDGYYGLRQSGECGRYLPSSAVYWEMWRGEQITLLDRNCKQVMQLRKRGDAWLGANNVALVRGGSTSVNPRLDPRLNTKQIDPRQQIDTRRLPQ